MMAARRPKVLFVGRSTGHFSYFESVIAGLMRRGAEVEMLLDEGWSKAWPWGVDKSAIAEFVAAHGDFPHDWLVRRKDKYRDWIFGLRELRSYRSYLVRKETTPYYIKRWQGYLTPEWKAKSESALFRALLKTPIAGAALRLAEDRTPPDEGIVALLKAKAPDVMLICPMNMRYSEEVDYAKAAMALGIPVAVTVISWDNLSTKGLIHVTPDRTFVWNRYQHEDAIEIQKLPKAKVTISGAPFFDKWFDKSSDLAAREAFCKEVGFDPARRILLYLGSSKNIAKDESWFVRTLKKQFAKSKNPTLKGYQILVRPHPAHFAVYKELDEEGVKVWPAGGALPETREAFAAMRNSFFHADAVIGINTSGMIDAVLADKPTFSVRLPLYEQTQSNSKHFKYLEDADALYLLDDVAELLPALKGLQTGKDPKAPQRRAFAELFARPNGLDRPAGDVVAEGVLAMAKARA